MLRVRRLPRMHHLRVRRCLRRVLVPLPTLLLLLMVPGSGLGIGRGGDRDQRPNGHPHGCGRFDEFARAGDCFSKTKSTTRHRLFSNIFHTFGNLSSTRKFRFQTLLSRLSAKRPNERRETKRRGETCPATYMFLLCAQCPANPERKSRKRSVCALSLSKESLVQLFEKLLPERPQHNTISIRETKCENIETHTNTAQKIQKLSLFLFFFHSIFLFSSNLTSRKKYVGDFQLSHQYIPTTIFHTKSNN